MSEGTVKAETPQSQETILKGIPASPGIAIGPVFVFQKHAPVVDERSILPEEAANEVGRLEQAIARSHKELRKILEFAEKKLGDDKVKIFEAQLMFLEDSVLFEAIYARIRSELKNAEFVVHDEIGKYHRIMLASKDEYTHERAHDVEDVQNRILRNLQEQKAISRLEGSTVIVSQNLTAGDALMLSRNDVLAYATDIGGITSHTALLSRALKIPAVVGLKTVSHLAHDGGSVVLDGYSGTIVLNPSEETVKKFEAKRTRYHEFEARLAGLRDLPAETLDHHRVELSANAEFEQELAFIKIQGADGIGLYRSEYLIVGKESFPTEEEQYVQYKLFAEAMLAKRVRKRAILV